MTISKGHLINTNLDESEQKIFRIMPFERFIELMTCKKLSFVRPVLWDDPFENFIMNSHSDCDSIKTAIYGQCWSLNIETDFMWRVYAPNKNGIKLHTNIKKFMNHIFEKNSFLENSLIFIGKVEYLPWDKTKEKFNGMSLYDSYFSRGDIKNIIANSLFIKRTEFSAESEVRVVYFYDEYLDNDIKVVDFEIEPNDFIEEVVIDSRISFDKYQILENLIREKLGYTGVISQSKLYSFEPLNIKE